MITRWWRAIRSAGPARLTYDAGLAIALTATAVGLPDLGRLLPAGLVVLVACVDIGSVLLRRAYPATALLTAAAVGTASGQNSFFLLIALSVSAGYRIRDVRRLAVALGATLPLQLMADLRADDEGGPAQVLVTACVFVAADLLPAVATWLAVQRRELLSLVRQRTEMLEEQQRTTAERVRIREVARIAGEMHDSLGHRLTLISLHTGALRSTQAPPPADVVRLVHTAAVQAMDEMHQILVVLRDGQNGAETEPLSAGLAELDRLVEGARAAGTRITLRREGTVRPLHPVIDHAAYRTLQEGLTNALRHAHGSRVRLALRYEPDAVIAEVVNGPGRPGGGPGGGRGLPGLAERVRLVGGVLYHGREPDAGFRLAATLPLTPQGPAAGAVDEVTVALRRADRRSRLGWAVLAASSVTVLLLCAAGWWTATVGSTVDDHTFRDMAIGATEAQVRSRLPDPAASVADPMPPPGLECVSYQARIRFRPDSFTGRYRFCFRDGLLVSKEMRQP
ncbi:MULTISPECIES: sensor histidine kinase [Catenuloplanes]|uniref:histidine kinase n=1 Tax=Catenuloplanes niger TaxID=587534 RepID=A0AAE3ZIM9_9ACTN|nr:histidine kinase [Catenuloplanes niger]MDR7320598.1 signal transduction histidine kinase [Catenuloplanes niger]